MIALTKVIPEDFSLFCLLVCFHLASVYFHIHALSSHTAYTVSSFDEIMLNIAELIAKYSLWKCTRFGFGFILFLVVNFQKFA